MTMLKQRTIAVAILVTVLMAFSIPQSMADGQRVYNTPPSALSGLSQDDLNAFGLKLITEAYEIRSKVEKPSGNAAEDLAKINSDSARSVVNLYDEDAIIQRARLNYGLTKKTYVPNHTGEFTISNIAMTQTSSTVLVVSFDVRLPNRMSLQSGIVYSEESAPRLLVLRWNATDGMWKIVSHGDFDPPRSFLCGANKDFMPEKSVFKPDDIKLAQDLLEQIQTASLNGTEHSVQAPGFQYVLASGERKTAPGKIRARIKKRQDIHNVEAIRSGDLLVVRADSYSSLTLDGGNVETERRPRLFTFHLGEDGAWRMNAIAIFSATSSFAADVECLKP